MNEQVQEFLNGLFNTEGLNISPEEFGGGFVFDPPLIAVAAGDDDLYDRYKELVVPRHKSPLEMWMDGGLNEPEGGASALRILAIVFPFSTHIREIAKKESEVPAEIYALARNWATGFMAEVQYRTVSWFKERGYEGLFIGFFKRELPSFHRIIKFN